MNKIKLIISREYLTRVKKKSFLIMTLLGPLLMAGLLVLIIWLGMRESNYQKIMVVDDNYPAFTKIEKLSNDNIEFNYSNVSLNDAKKLFHSSDYTSILYIPKNIMASNSVKLFFKKQPSTFIQKGIENKVEDILEQIKLNEHKVSRETFYKIKTNLILSGIKFKKPGEEETVDNEIAYVGFAFSIIIYIFIFMYGVQVMRGVIEEKTSRIVEVIISSVKPFQLMLGKIIGVALVGLTQFVLWVLLTTTLVSVGQTLLFGDSFDPTQIQQQVQMTNDVMQDAQKEAAMQAFNMSDPNNIINRINFPLLLGMFLIYFLGGYLLYSALFAAVGAAVDSETDTQQFMLPITMPLIFAYMMSTFIIQNPEGPAAFWLSIIPFTSPIIMIIKVATNTALWWELALSILLLIGGFIFTTWVAARIYKTGILMYGKKVNYKELWKWLRQSN